MKPFSQLLSVILHPIFMPLYGLFLYTNIKHSATLNLRLLSYGDYFRLAISPILLFGIIFPIFSLMVMHRSKMITSFEVKDRKERLPVLLLSSIYYGITYYFVRSLDIAYQHAFFKLFLCFLTGGILLTLLSLIITLRWKISLHGIGIGALCGASLAFTQELQPLANIDTVILINTGLLILVGLLASARLALNAHSISQVVAGSLLGIILEYVVISKHYWI